jgi:beta-lactamase class A
VRVLRPLLLALAIATGIALAGLRPTPAAAEAPPISDLEARLAALVAGAGGGGEYSVAVTDLQTGETVAVNGDRHQLSGCSINLFVLMQAVADLQAGRYEEPLVRDLIARTIYSSNPVTARDLYRIAGDGDVTAGTRRVAALIAGMGLTATVLDHPPGFLGESIRTLPDNWNNWMTALDSNRALALLYAGEIVTADWRDYLLRHLASVKPGLNYLTAYGPAGTVSHKNGFFRSSGGGWVDNDVGIVRFERGGQAYAYAISFFSQRVPEKYGDIPLGQSLSAATWEFFSRRYP